jgi:hypothetical protein
MMMDTKAEVGPLVVIGIVEEIVHWEVSKPVGSICETLLDSQSPSLFQKGRKAPLRPVEGNS